MDFLSGEFEWPLKTRYSVTSSEDKPNPIEARMVTRDKCTQRRQKQRHWTGLNSPGEGLISQTRHNWKAWQKRSL